MKLTTQSNKPFDTHPEYNGLAVCVDVTAPKTVQTDYGPKEQFRFVFETTQLRDDGKPYLVWSRGFNTTLGEKSALRAFLKLTQQFFLACGEFYRRFDYNMYH